MPNILVTGGAGFIGSNLVIELLKKNDNHIYVFDDLSTGRINNLPVENKQLEFFKINLSLPYEQWPVLKDLDMIYHLAANADVRGGEKNREIDFIQNVVVTKSVCDYAKKYNTKHVVFASSATVYGEPNVFPTKESDISCQTSVYGASKLCGEAYLQAYSEYSDFTTTIFRFVSWIGKGYSHGVIYDFYKKLLDNPKELYILGDGKQCKSFLDVTDGVKGIIELVNHNSKVEIFNLGHNQVMNILTLADNVCNYLNLGRIKYYFSGSERGWTGDSPFVHLDIDKANSFGWEPNVSIEDGIKNTLDYLTSDKENIFR